MTIPPVWPSPHVVRLEALGANIEVRVTGDSAHAASAEIQRVWHLCVSAQCETAPDGVIHAVHDTASPTTNDLAEGRVENSSLPDLLQMLTQAVTRAAIDAQAGRLVMLHAAGIQDPATGAVVALVGPGGTGKTTLIRTLGPGRGYITDETVAITVDHNVLPYPKPLSVRRRPHGPWKDETDPLHFGALTPVLPATLAAIVLLDRKDGHAGPPHVERVATLDAIAALTPETSHLPEMDKPLQRMAKLCDAVGGVERVTYGEAGHLTPWVDRWLGGGA